MSDAVPRLSPMTVLQNRWYNALVACPGLSGATFQISQPAPPLTASDDALWSYQDVVPPVSLTCDRSLSTNRYFDAYAALAAQLRFPDTAFAADVGEITDWLWEAHLATIDPPPAPSDLPGLFSDWAAVYAPSVASAGAADLATQALIAAAEAALQPYLGPHPTPPDYAGGYADLAAVLAAAQPASVTLDSRITSADVSHTWPNGEDSGVAGLFQGCGIETCLSRKFAASRVTVSARFDAYALWRSTPGGWYSSSLLAAGYGTSSGPPWPADPNPTWDEFFGPGGSLRRVIGSLVAVAGVTATITSDAAYGTADQQTITDLAPAGVWPFYLPAGAGATSTVEFDAAGTLTIAIASPAGRPIVIGANVLTIGQALGTELV